MSGASPFNAEKAVKELAEAGWVNTHAFVWKCPTGLYFRGPAKAWEMMKKYPQLSEVKP